MGIIFHRPFLHTTHSIHSNNRVAFHSSSWISIVMHRRSLFHFILFLLKKAFWRSKEGNLSVKQKDVVSREMRAVLFISDSWESVGTRDLE